jgi:hypothetical protein
MNRFFRNYAKTACCLGVLISFVLAGCGHGDKPTNEPIDQFTAPIATEHGGGVAQVATRFYGDPDRTLVGYAVPDVGGCTATMIGPNMLMTASHCGDTDRYATFHLYRNLNYSQPTTESFYCRILLNTFHHSDIALLFCDPNSSGENPGDKYGYLDFDVSAPTLNEQLYSFWYNPIVSLGLGWDLIYSNGKVTDTSANIWGPNPTDSGPINEPDGIGTDIWSQPGCSGSSIIRASNNRITVGPTSTAVYDAAGRWALSSKTYFERGSVDGWTDAHVFHSGVHDATLTSLGLGGSYYVGRLDKNNNYLFDVQEDLERLRGENRRDWYFLGFNSERRNALWSIDNQYTSFDTGNQIANLNVTIPSIMGGWTVLANRHLPLDNNTKYRITFMLYTASASSTNGLRVVLRQGTVEQNVQNIPTNAGAGWTMHTFAFTTRSANPELAFIIQGTFSGAVTAVSVIKDGAVMDFDSADKRYNWRNDNNGARGSVLPDGETAGSTPNWAGAVNPDPTRARGTDWPLRNRQLAIVPGVVYKVCFDVKQKDSPLVNVDNRAMRILSAGAEVVRASFRPTASWTQVCTGEFRAPTEDNNMQLGFEGPSASSYYIDNIRIQRQPCGTYEDGCPSNQVCVNNACVCQQYANPCDGIECGSVPSDSCGHLTYCGGCRAGLVCRENQCLRANCCPNGCPHGRVCDPVACTCVIPE